MAACGCAAVWHSARGFAERRSGQLALRMQRLGVVISELLYLPCILPRASCACYNPVHKPSLPMNRSTETSSLPVLPPASGALSRVGLHKEGALVIMLARSNLEVFHFSGSL